MPKLRRLPADFEIRSRGFRSPQASLKGGERTEDLIASYELACRAGRSIQPIVRSMGLPLDFSNGTGVRIEQNQVVLVLESAAVQTRLKNLQNRLLEKLVADGVPVTGINFRVRGRRRPVEEEEKPEPVRTPSIIAAAELHNAAKSLMNRDLGAQIEALARTLEPSEGELPFCVLQSAGSQRERLTRLGALARAITEKLPNAPGMNLIPSEERTRGNPEFAAVRERMLARLARRQEAEAAADAATSAMKTLTARLDDLEARVLAEETGLPENFRPLADEVIALSKDITVAIRAAEESIRVLDDRAAEAELEKARKKKVKTESTSAEADEEVATALSETGTASPAAAALRANLRDQTPALKKSVRSARELIAKALKRLPSPEETPEHDERLAAELARFAALTARGTRRGAADQQEAIKNALTPEITRRLLVWEERQAIEDRLHEIDDGFAAMEKALDDDRAVLRIPRKFTASALAADFAALKSVDARRTADMERLGVESAESETLAEAVEILAEAAAHGESAANLSQREIGQKRAADELKKFLREVRVALGSHPNELIIPSEEEAAVSKEEAGLRERLLARLAVWKEKEAALAEAETALANVRKVLQSPRDGAVPGTELDGREKALRHAFALAAAAAEKISPALTAPDFDKASAEELPGVVPDLNAGKPAGHGKAAGAPSAAQPSLFPETVPVGDLDDHTVELLEATRDILPVWEDRLPKKPVPELIPPEEDCVNDETLRLARTRMLARGERRAALEARLRAIDEELRAVEALRHNPLRNPAEVARRAKAVLEEADRFSADLAKK